MNYKECKEKYDIYNKSLESKKSLLKKKEQEINAICSEYDSVSSTSVIAKEELEKSQNNLNDYTKKKFSKSIMKLFGTLVLLSIAIVIVIGCSDYGFVSTLLCGPAFLIVDAMILGGYSFIQEAIPEFIQSFWKKDKKFNELKELVEIKKKELSVAESNRDRVFNRVSKCRKDIINLKDHIAYIEHDISELMLAFAPTLFSEDVDEQDKTYEKPYTKIRRQENQN